MHRARQINANATLKAALINVASSRTRKTGFIAVLFCLVVQSRKYKHSRKECSAPERRLEQSTILHLAAEFEFDAAALL
jgi:hypothetical protein